MSFVLFLIAATQISQSSPLTKGAVPTSFTQVISECRAQEKCEGEWRDLKYRLHSDHSAYFEAAPGGLSWEFSCRIDQMDDQRSCSLIAGSNRGREAPYLLVLWGDGWTGPAVSVAHGQQAYPQTEELLRVDRNAAFSIDADSLFSGQRALAIISQLKRGERVRLRYYDWPYNYSHDSDLPLKGFTAVWEATTELRKLRD
jgi:hypothetical protein